MLCFFVFLRKSESYQVIKSYCGALFFLIKNENSQYPYFSLHCTLYVQHADKLGTNTNMQLSEQL